MRSPAGRSKPTWAGPCLSRTCFSNFILWRYAASVTLKSGSEGARKQDLGRRHVSASAECQPPRLGEARRSQPRRERRRATDTVSRSSNVRVRGAFASRKWLVSLTGEVPVSSAGVRASGGKPTYKSTTKSAAMRFVRTRGPSASMTFVQQPWDSTSSGLPSSGPQQIRSSARQCLA